MNSQDVLISFARQSLGLSSSDRSDLAPFSGRGSDRAYYRFRWGIHSAIVVQYQSARIENSYFADIAEFLFVSGIPVPRILSHDRDGGLILLEDLGDTDLWLLRDAPWDQRRKLYRKTLAAVHALHSIPEMQFPSDRIRLMEGFGPELYRWERNYFRENFVDSLCGIRPDAAKDEALETELAALADSLSSAKRCLVHRDLQSQNVMICNGTPFLIDFQGMRFGSRFYDLGSLLCDPYVTFADAERMDLLAYYYGLSKTGTDWDGFVEAFWLASAQRLMQALGAYGFLALKKGLHGYLAHAPGGLRNLRAAATNARVLPLLRELCEECARALEA